MATITFGSEDAIYGSGVYNEAVYGEFGPTLLINGVSGSSSAGTLDVSANASTSINGVTGTSFVGNVTADVTELIETGPPAAQSSVGTVQVNISEILVGASATGFAGELSFNAQANTTTGGTEGTALEGTAEASGGALESLTGVEGTTALGTVIIVAAVGLEGQQLNSSLGVVKPNIVEYIPGVFATGATNTTEEFGEANETLTPILATSQAGNTTETGVVFNFEAVKETYDRKRTVRLSRVA